MINRKTITAIIIVILVLASGLKYAQLKEQLEISENLLESTHDRLEVWKDKDSMNHAKILVMETQSARDFVKMKTADSTIIALQDLVADYKRKIKNGGSATVVETSTNVSGSASTTVTFTDTASELSPGIDEESPGMDLDTVYPTYTSNFNMKGWVIGTTVANKDSTTLDFKIKNSYSIILGEERQGWFKPKKPFAEVINDNPYTEIKSLRSYRVKPVRKKHFSLGPGAGVDFNGKPQAGVYVIYNLLRF